MLTDPGAYFRDRRLLLDYQGQRLGHGAGQILSRARERLARDSAALDAMSPLKVLGRGYSIARNENGTLIASVKDAAPGERLELRLSDGSLGVPGGGKEVPVMAGKKLDFEQSMARLEEIVGLLERGDAPLDEAMALFEEGAKLMRECTKRLDQAEQKVTLLTAGEDGQPREEPFGGGL